MRLVAVQPGTAAAADGDEFVDVPGEVGSSLREPLVGEEVLAGR